MSVSKLSRVEVKLERFSDAPDGPIERRVALRLLFDRGVDIYLSREEECGKRSVTVR